MNFFEKMIKAFEIRGRKQQVNRTPPAIELVRQNRPPDERDVDAAEEACESGLRSDKNIKTRLPA